MLRLPSRIYITALSHTLTRDNTTPANQLNCPHAPNLPTPWVGV